MPFRSEAQRRWMYATHPQMAARWQAETPTDASLPERKGASMAKKKQSNFDKLASQLAQRPGVTNPKALSAFIGRKKYGASTMARAASEGQPAANVRK